MAFPLIYLGYLGAAALAGLFTSACNSEEKKEKNEEKSPLISAEPPPRPVLAIDEREPAYGVYLKLKEVGLSLNDMDRNNDLKIPDEELFNSGHLFYKNNLSAEKNKEIHEQIETSFQEASDRYFNLGAEKSGVTFPAACEAESFSFFKKAFFWNHSNERALWVLGVCEAKPERLRNAININPEFKEAKQALEKVYRDKTEANPKDPEAWKGLGDALKMQEKVSEANAAYQKASQLNLALERGEK